MGTHMTDHNLPDIYQSAYKAHTHQNLYFWEIWVPHSTLWMTLFFLFHRLESDFVINLSSRSTDHWLPTRVCDWSVWLQMLYKGYHGNYTCMLMTHRSMGLVTLKTLNLQWPTWKVALRKSFSGCMKTCWNLNNSKPEFLTRSTKH